MELFFSNHAQEKLKQRHIIKKYVIETVCNPDYVRYTRMDRKEFFKKYNTLYLKAVVKEINTTRIIITTHWVGKTPLL